MILLREIFIFTYLNKLIYNSLNIHRGHTPTLKSVLMKKIDLTGYTSTQNYHRMEPFSGHLATDGVKK